MALLPSFFMLKSGGRYLSVTENVPANLPSGFLKFDEEQIWSPRAKFAAEPAADGSGLFHIRSVYNNKYLVTKQVESNSWLVASAKKPEEDKSKASSCTLFEPHSLAADDDQTVRLRHVGTGISATHSDDHQGVLLSASIGSSFILKDSASVVVLPSQVTFQSQDLNANYLGTVFLYDNLVYQKFESGLDVADKRVAKELVRNADGTYYIKDLYTGKFWVSRSGWIQAEPGDYLYQESLFSFEQIEGNVFGLRNLGNDNALCGAYTESKSINCLRAFYPTFTKQTWLIVGEPVLEREITDVEYRISDARIYNETVQEIDHEFGNNMTQNDNEMTLHFSTTDSRTTSWNNSVSINFGIKVTFKTSVVPFIEEGDIEMSTDFGYSHEWGGSVTTETTRDTSYNVTVPPLQTVKVTMLATKGDCDVPFSYTQRDLTPTGWVETKKDDGLFTGSNSYDVHYKSEVVPPS